MSRPAPRSVAQRSDALAIIHFPLKLAARRMLAPTVAHLAFVRDDGQPLDFIPGQFVQVHFHYADGTATKRSYSLATIHDHAMGAGRDGRDRGQLRGGRRGDGLVRRPGHRRHDRRQRPLWPLLPDAGRRQPALPADRHRHRRHAVSRDAAAAGTAHRASAASRWCCCSARARRWSCCTATSSAPSPSKHPEHFRFVPCFSRELPAADSPQAHADVRHGYVQQFLQEFAPDAAQRHRLPVRQPEHGRCVLRGAEGRRPAGAADPPREVRQQQVVPRSRSAPVCVLSPWMPIDRRETRRCHARPDS